MWSASSLMRYCAYPNILKRNKKMSPSTQEACDRGTAFHAAVEAWVRGGVLPQLEDMEMQGWLDVLASRWVPPKTALVEAAWGLGEDGSHIEVVEPEPHVYKALNGGAPLLTAGRADVAWYVERYDNLIVIDWKTGRWPTTPAQDNLQVNAAGIALANKIGAKNYQPCIYYVRDGFLDQGDIVSIGSFDYACMMDGIQAAARLPEAPVPGDHCASCWERRNCPEAHVPF